MQQRLALLGLGFLSLFLFLKVDPSFDSVEKRIYTYYSVSVVEDLDLNVINQIPPKEMWLVSSTYNYPDVHSNGIAVLWAPFLFVSKLIHDPGTGYQRIHEYLASQAVVNVFYGLMSILLFWLLLKPFFSPSIRRSAILAIVFCTTMIWYLIFQPENADMTALFVSTCIANLYVRRKYFDSRWFSFLLGVALLFGAAVKFDLIFSGILFLHFLIENRHRGIKYAFGLCSLFSVGAALLLVPILINERIKNGFWTYTYFDTVEKQVYMLNGILFSATGYFVTHPFYALVIVAFLFLAIRKHASSEFWFYFFIPMSKLLLESFNYDRNQAYGPRHWLDDNAYFLLVFAYVIDHFPKNNLRKIFWIGCLISFITSVVAGLAYHIDYETFYYFGHWLSILSKARADQFQFLTRFSWWQEKSNILPFIFGMSCLVPFLAWRISKIQTPRVFAGLLMAGASAYILITVANYFNNEKSIALVPKELIEKAVVSNGPHMNSFYENAGSIQLTMTTYEKIGDAINAAYRRKMLEDYVQMAAKEILKDPVGFRESLVPGRPLYVPRYLWDDE